ncbi:MAG: methionyl-tRNA formyltransferase [Chloroflexi bacterium]|nr:methionyl-tRNA formyltransferase [Chloroflexota bacterium]
MVKIVFMGTPEFSVPTLKALAAAYDVIGVVTQPDRPAGRSREPLPPPVKVAADMLGIPVIQPERLRNPDAIDALKQWPADLFVVAAFGQILPQSVLDLPRLGCLNVHASLLPRWRGASPIQHAIKAGDARTGVTIMKMDAGLDTGPILTMHEIDIAPDETSATLHERLSKLGAEVLIPAIAGYVDGTIVPRPQPGEGVTSRPANPQRRRQNRVVGVGGADRPSGARIHAVAGDVHDVARASGQGAEWEGRGGQPAGGLCRCG